METCRRDMWPVSTMATMRLDQYCRCMLEWCQDKWTAEELNRVLVRSATGGWGGTTGGRYRYPAAMQQAMSRCKTQVDEGLK